MKFYPRNKPLGHPTTVILTKLQGKTVEKQFTLIQIKTPKIELSDWVWADKFSQATTAIFFSWQFH